MSILGFVPLKETDKLGVHLTLVEQLLLVARCYNGYLTFTILLSNHILLG